MLNRSMLPPPSDITAQRCPRCHKLLDPDIGQHETHGDLRYRLVCLNDGYYEDSAPTVKAAKRTSSTLAEALRNLRLRGVVVPMDLVQTPWPKEESDV